MDVLVSPESGPTAAFLEVSYFSCLLEVSLVRFTFIIVLKGFHGVSGLNLWLLTSGGQSCRCHGKLVNCLHHDHD